MSTLNTPSETLDGSKTKVASYLYFGSLYFVSVGTLYLWGYWSPFGVNILEYIGLSDIIKSTAYPIASTFLFLAIGAIAGEGTSGADKLPPGGGSDTKIGIFLRKFSRVLLFAYTLAAACFLIFGPIYKWLVVPVLFAMPFTIIVKERGLFRDQLRDESVRTIAIFLAATMPPYAYGLGRISADQIMSGKQYSYVVAGPPGIGVAADVQIEAKPRFIGQAGDYVFFFDPLARTMEISKFSSGKPLVIGYFDGKQRSIAAGPNSSIGRASFSRPRLQ